MSDEHGNAASSAMAKPVVPVPKGTGTLAFSLVVIMLGILFLLVLGLLFVPPWYKADEKLLEYCKWALSVLLGAFGAWIGAGAAYFFGKENLTESSRSTEAALRIQQEALRTTTRKDRVKDLALTAMNTNFLFNPTGTKKEVVDKLNQYPDYWWVPVLDKEGKGVLEDIVHARVFWTPAFVDADPISKILSDLDTSATVKDLKALHGSSFFVRASLDDRIADLSDTMAKLGAVVGVVVDDKGKPTYCFTRQDIATAQK